MKPDHEFDRVIILTHPAHMPFYSIHIFCNLLQSNLQKVGIKTSTLTSKSFAPPGEAPSPSVKVLRYIDQYLFFPIRLLRVRASNDRRRTLYIFIDQALGPWIPFLSKRNHCIYVHDFAALRKSRGYFPEQKATPKERLNQSLIAAGVRRGKNFICISEKSKQDLLELINPPGPINVAVIPNPINYEFQPLSKESSRVYLGLNVKSNEKIIIYVGTCAFNKNIPGLLHILASLKSHCSTGVRLLMVSEPTTEATDLMSDLAVEANVIVYRRVDPQTLNHLYCAADALLLPSLHEGFGWPLIEAQACGTPVVTVDAPPMRDVAGAHSLLIQPLSSALALTEWAEVAAHSIAHLLSQQPARSEALKIRCISWAQQFKPQTIFRKYFEYFDMVSKA